MSQRFKDQLFVLGCLASLAFTFAVQTYTPTQIGIQITRDVVLRDMSGLAVGSFKTPDGGKTATVTVHPYNEAQHTYYGEFGIYTQDGELPLNWQSIVFYPPPLPGAPGRWELHDHNTNELVEAGVFW